MNGVQEPIAVAACAHPELFSYHNVPTNEWYYLCTSCPKRVAIPLMAILIAEDSKHVSHQQATHAARQQAVTMIGQAFGKKWQEQMQREADR